MLRSLLVVALLVMLVMLAGAAQADPLLTVPDLSLGAVAAAGGNPGVGACLSYPVAELGNAKLFADLGLLMDGSATQGFFGMSTDKRLPLVDQLPGEAFVGVGWCEPSSTWLVYLRYEVF